MPDIKLIISIPEDEYNIIKKSNAPKTWVEHLIANGTPLPKGATNGDRIKAIFPDCKDWKAKIEDNNEEVYEVHFVQLPNSMTINKYEESWWNAPYKAESEG